MTLPRTIFPGRTYLITRRCTQREFLLRPDDKVNEALRYLLLRAAEKYNVRIGAGIIMSNHWHLGVHDVDGGLPDFMQYLHSLVDRVLNCARGRWENFWSVDQANACRLVQIADVIAKSVYTLSNPVTDHLVDKSIHWPGLNTFAWLDGRTVTAHRPKFFFSPKSKLPLTITAKLIALPDFKGTFAEWAALLRAGVAEEERAAAAERAKTGARVLGRKAVLAASPHQRPTTIEPRRGMRPFIAAKSRKVRRAAIHALAEFRRWHAFAKAMFKLGWRDVPFPAGTWAMVHVAGVSLAPS